MTHRKLPLMFSSISLALLLWLPPGALPRIAGQEGPANSSQGDELRPDDGQGGGRRADPCEGSERAAGEARGLRRRCQAGGSGGVSRGDFNGDGFADLAIGVPGEDLDGLDDAGAVHIIYGSANGLSAAAGPQNQFVTAAFIATIEQDNFFGTSVAAGNFDGDNFSDLAIGIAGETVNGQTFAGEVHVLYGSANGLTAARGQVLDQGFNGLADVAETGDRFGQVLSWGDFNGDTFGDLAVGVPSENVGSIIKAGAVHVIYGSPSGLTTAGNQFWHQDSPGILDAAERFDFFGEALTAGDFNNDGVDDLAIGVEHEDFGEDTEDAGAVNVLYGSFGSGLTEDFNQFWHQDTGGIFDGVNDEDKFGSALAAGDFNGDGRDDLAIGVSGEDIDGVGNAGVVHVIYGSSDRLTSNGNQFWRQNSSDVLDVAETDDRFGSALAAGDFNGDGRDDLAIGVPFEDVGGLTNAGAVHVIYGTSSGLRASVTISGQTLLTNQFWTENNANFNGAAEAFDLFGRSLSAWNFGRGTPADLAIGIPSQDVGSINDAGAVLVLYGRPLTSGSVSVEGLSTTGRQVWTQDSPGILDQAEELDNFGSSLY